MSPDSTDENIGGLRWRLNYGYVANPPRTDVQTVRHGKWGGQR
jgi:hypothetical protein